MFLLREIFFPFPFPFSFLLSSLYCQRIGRRLTTTRNFVICSIFLFPPSPSFSNHFSQYKFVLIVYFADNLIKRLDKKRDVFVPRVASSRKERRRKKKRNRRIVKRGEKEKKKTKEKCRKCEKSLSLCCAKPRKLSEQRVGKRLLTRPVICLSFAGYAKEPSRQSTWSNQPDQVQRYFCPRCCSSFSKKANMLTHFRYECGKEPRFQCPYCGKRDRKSSNTYRHIRTYHQGSRIQAYKLY